jgi:peptidoglycan/xylan/chitin deacetylase (PgdA/CDA1 family)
VSDNPPHFLIEMPPNRRSEREYALAVLFEDWLGATYAVRVVDGLDETRVRPSSEPDQIVLAIPDVLLARSTKWLSPESLPPPALPSIRLPSWTGLEGTMPLLYAVGASPTELLNRDGERLVLSLDLLGSLVFMLTRYEEYAVAGRRDEHDRFPASAAVVASSGWLQWPILDMYLLVFVAALKVAWPRLHLGPAPGSGVLVSHDVDHPSAPARWHGRQRLRIVAADLVRRRDIRLALRRASSFMTKAGSISRHDPFNSYRFLMAASEAAGVRSTFFLLANDTELPDGSRFRLTDRWAMELIAEIAERGHQIGLHGSYNSSTDSSRLAEEWALLEDACAGIAPGVLRRAIRQHYLRGQQGVTWRAQAEAGLTVDESLGFADAIGYRAGTARSFMAYDLERHRQLTLRVRPLHVMDVTLLGYMSVGLEAGFEMVAEMIRRTRQYGGAFSILWHNSSLETPRARQFYLKLLAELTGAADGVGR